MGETLFLAHRVPFPPNRGDKIRSHHLLKAVAALGPVHLGTFGETDEDMACEVELAGVARSHCLVRRTKPLPQAGLEALASGKPVSLTAFASPRLHGWVAETLARYTIDRIVVFSGQMGQYVPAGFDGPVVIDLCDVDSAKFEAYARDHSWPRATLDRREARLLAREEERLAQRADVTLLVTEAEATLFRSRLQAPDRADVRALRNGIDTDGYDPARVDRHPELAPDTGPHLVFTGQMDYPPNVAAVARMASTILPHIRLQHPTAQFHVVGRAPAAEVRNLDGQGGVRVWGEVPDVKPFLASADLVVAPLTIARGVQNKVLEAMAMARPVVLSTDAATGIDARDGEHFAVGQDDAALVRHALALLSNPSAAQAMGQSARDFVVRNQGWEAMLAPLAGMLSAPQGCRDAA
ncbi:TIGR03087 family PEP-CTERM/XrtA system glycosyltransferase [Altererythrobacter sp. H2]|uniref:TIGR03087 family PEP-CTERM/XrtA system glycosyltransferase n=1 Tax=Altererythrobacter sp. H2 TaxID=3108391 RepID=UPI002B4BEB47|nr:TIGR03087 family PEP-CTERM/XrtA system glycosyltransferase [Altererythrobacter sp. H2]WRK94754.1 TIGR03087 family PEP-CTERM/XrtA system glycosyltransferase [Altererythrobacter sp. H2]